MYLPLNILLSKTHLCHSRPHWNLPAACEASRGLTPLFSGVIGVVGGTGSSNRGWHEKPAAPHYDSKPVQSNWFVQQRSRCWPNATAVLLQACVSFLFFFHICLKHEETHESIAAIHWNSALWYIQVFKQFVPQELIRHSKSLLFVSPAYLFMVLAAGLPLLPLANYYYSAADMSHGYERPL